MKKIYLALLCLLVSSKIFASGIQGGELRYEFTGTNYRVYYTLYHECNGHMPDTALGATVYFYSSSCGYNFNRSLPFLEYDTLTNLYCASASVGCSGGSYPYWIATVFSDTVSLSACNDWKIYASASSLDVIAANITPDDMYLEAFLDNSVAINSNAKIANYPPFYLTNDSVNTIPVQAVDADDDSIDIEMMVPQTDMGSGPGGRSELYTSGYNSSSPLGSGSYTITNNATQLLTIRAGALLSNDFLAMKTSEYRAGKLVGYFMREWLTLQTPYSSAKAPLPQTGTSFVHTTCPGKTDTITITLTDSNTHDSVFALVNSSFTWPYTEFTTMNPATSSATATIIWTTPATLDPSVTPNFTINIEAYDTTCSVRGLAYYTVLVKTAACNTDSVYPGDANDDKTANIYDPLAIAVAYGQTGPTRTSPTISWIGQYCANWPSSFVSGVNMKYADCNGDGTVDTLDLAAVTANYGLVHAKGNIKNAARIAGLPDLYFDLTGITISPGTTVSIPIKIGDATIPMNNLYGIATTIDIGGMPLDVAPTISYPTSWLGTSANTLSFTKTINSNKIDWAYARTNHSNATGQGTIATLNLTIPTTASAGEMLYLNLMGTKVVDSTGRPMPKYNVLNDSGTIQPTGVANIVTPIQYAEIIPNPSTSQSQLKMFLNSKASYEVKIVDVVGRVIWQQNETNQLGSQNIELPSATLMPGMYMIHIDGNDWKYPLVLKWIKQ